MMKRITTMALLLAAIAASLAAQPALPAAAPPGPSPTLGLAPPPGAVVLFDGKDVAKWTRMDGSPAPWKVADGAMTSGGGDIRSQDTFQDAYVHLEWMEPDMPEAQGQARGNSGVTLQGRYEVQVLDSFGIDVPGKGDCGAIYGQHAALVNACRPPLEWQTYDIIFRGPRFGPDKQLLEHARLTVLQNGIVIQNNVQVTGVNYPPLETDISAPGPLLLQDHGNPVQYRNVWFVPLPEKGSEEYQGHRGTP
jgi:hypothetical protein